MPDQLEPMIESVREACIEQIQRQYALGRLSQDDLDDRVGLALQAKTPSALSALTADLTPAPATPAAAAPVPIPVPGRTERGRRRRTVLAIAGAAAVLAAGVGVLGLAAGTGGANQAVASAYCEATGTDDPGQACPARSAAQIRLDAYADQLRMARGEIESYEPSKELLARVERGSRLADVAQARARAEALIEAAGGKPDKAALEKLALELEAAVRDSAEALAEAAAGQPR